MLAKPLRDLMHFLIKHADDVVRGVGGSGRAERVTQAVNNMSEFFETEFGQKIVGSLRKTKKKFDGQSVYEVMKKVDRNLRKEITCIWMVYIWTILKFLMNMVI